MDMLSKCEITTFKAPLFPTKNPIGNEDAFPGRTADRAGEEAGQTERYSMVGKKTVIQSLLRSRRLAVSLALMATVALLRQTAAAAEADTMLTNSASVANGPDTLGGASSVGAQLKADDQAKEPTVCLTPMERYDQWLRKFRKDLKDSTGLTLGGDYNALVQGASESLGEDWAASGVFRVYGHWAWPGEPWKNPGSFTFKFENRHRYTDIAPQQLGGQLGYTALTADTWSDAGWLLSNFYWYQQFLNNRLAFAAGVMDVTDYVDTYGMVNPWTDYMNSVFLTSPTMAFPNQGLGAAVRGSITTNLYVLAGFANANGDPTEPLDQFETFFDEAEFFTHVELGWVSSWERRQQDNIHMTLWQTPARSQAGIPSGWGGTVSASHLFADRWLPFFRAGWSDGGGGVPYEGAVAVGTGYYMRSQSDLLAVGFNWGRPSSETYGSRLGDEYTIELLYRVHLLHRFTVTPDIQVLINPALNPDADVVGVFGLRARLVF